MKHYYEILSKLEKERYIICMYKSSEYITFELCNYVDINDIILKVRIYIPSQKECISYNVISYIQFNRKKCLEELLLLMKFIHDWQDKYINILPYYHLYQYIDIDVIKYIISDIHSHPSFIIQDVLNGVPAYIPLHEYKAKIQMLKNTLLHENDLTRVYEKLRQNSEITTEEETHIKTIFKKIISLPYITWSIDISSLELPEIHLISEYIIEENDVIINDENNQDESIDSNVLHSHK